MIGKLKSKTGERYFFLAITILNLIPVLACRFFPTMDGAAHLYNSNIINELVFKSNPHLSTFFTLNTFPVPNWTGHFILSFINLFLSAFIAEKILLLFYLIALPYSFRQLIKTIAPKGVLLSYFIFPFTYSFLLLLGFYNFLLALVFMFITLNYKIKNEREQFSTSKIFVLVSLLMLVYFSHIAVFITTLFILLAHSFFRHIFENKSTKSKVKIIALALSLKAYALLFIYYFSTVSTSGNATFITTKELAYWLKRIIVFNPQREEVFTKIVFYLIFSLAIIAVHNSVKLTIKRLKESTLKNSFLTVVSTIFNCLGFWLIPMFIFLILYFLLPDSTSNAGYVSTRLGLLFFLLLIIWLSSQKIQKWIVIIAASIVLFCHFNLLLLHHALIKDLNKIAESCYSASAHIAANSIVLPLNYSDNWLTGHFSNYLGVDKPMIILENYECGTRYFPVRWNEPEIPNVLLGNAASTDFPCLQWKSNNQSKPEKIDYVFVSGKIETKTDTCGLLITEKIKENYSLIFENENCQLFEKKI